jgi:adenylate kinase
MPPNRHRGTTYARRRKPRDLARSLILDQLEKIEEAARRRPIDDVEADFILKAHKSAVEEASVDIEADFLEGLTDKQLNKVYEDTILTIEHNEEDLKALEDGKG